MGRDIPAPKEKTALGVKHADKEDKQDLFRHTPAQCAALQTTLSPLNSSVLTSLSRHGHRHLKATRSHIDYDIVMCG